MTVDIFDPVCGPLIVLTVTCLVFNCIDVGF